MDIPDLLAEVERLHAENAKLRKTIEDIEWIGTGWCPWCFRWRMYGHAPDCKRQKALGIEVVVPDIFWCRYW